jgi:hypothetical protein
VVWKQHLDKAGLNSAENPRRVGHFNRHRSIRAVGVPHVDSHRGHAAALLDIFDGGEVSAYHQAPRVLGARAVVCEPHIGT